MNYNPTLHKLSNGITVILDPMELETVTVNVFFCTGSRDELPHEYGITHFCEHMLCGPTPRFPTKRSRLDFLEYRGGVFNAGTSNTFLKFYGRILADNVNDLIGVLGDMIQNASFNPDDIEIERRIILDELRRTLDDSYKAFWSFISEKLFNWAVYSSHNAGTVETINSFTRDQLLEFLSRRLSAKNCIIGISGKINDENAVLECLEKTFGFLPAIDVPENTNIEYTPMVAHESKNGNNTRIAILFPDVCNAWPTAYEHRFKYSSASKFEGFMIREITDIVREQNGLVYGFSGMNVGNEKFNLSGFFTQTAPDNIAKVVALIAKNAYKIYTEQTITDEDLYRIECRNNLFDADWLESSSARVNRLIDFYRDYGRLYDFPDAVKMSKSVRRDDVIKYSRGYFDGPMSIITRGADFNADLASIWYENFK